MYKKIVLAYSGGLDTSIIIPWLKQQYPDTEIYGICVNVGQDEDWDYIKNRGRAAGATDISVVDAREEFAENYLFPLIRSRAYYEERYMLGTSIARPLQAKLQVEYAHAINADALAHGCTGRGNDQVRFELTYKALAPELPIIAPWRIWEIRSREDAIAYAQKNSIHIGSVSQENIFSRDWNMWHISHEGGYLEDTQNPAENSLFLLTKNIEDTPDTPEDICIKFEKSKPVALDGKTLTLKDSIAILNEKAGQHGVGRRDIIESRVVGMKSRGVYETPAGTVLYEALGDLEAIILDEQARSLKAQLAIRYGELIYAGKFFTQVRAALDAAFASLSQYISGEVTVRLYKGSVTAIKRNSHCSLYDAAGSFGDDGTQHGDAAGFINLYGLSTQMQGHQRNADAVKNEN